MANNNQLSQYFSLHRRYYRSVNLERDVSKVGAVEGYVLTERASEALHRITSAFGNPDSHRAWTITGVYGTGKSAFAHYLTALFAPEESDLRETAFGILKKAFGSSSEEYKAAQSVLPKKGVFRAVATGQREPLSWTIARALNRGVELFWNKGRKPKLYHQLTDWIVELENGKAKISNQQILSIIQEISTAANAPIFLLIDELGKNLEFAAHNQGVDDLYLLQQIAELELASENQVYFLGLLHQSFAGYSERLAAVEQSEWMKIQGRFEDLPFTESPSQMTRLMGQAIEHSRSKSILEPLKQSAKQWVKDMDFVLAEKDVTESVLLNAYPMHPVTSLVLPLLCVRYAQNDRSLFTFLTSDEPYALPAFLDAAQFENKVIPTLQLHQLYDYFVESVTGLASRINLQRWVEIQDLIEDAQDQSAEVLKVLKTIGILNLITTTGAVRATPKLVALALCDLPRKADINQWNTVISDLQKRGIITYRKQLDELRIWEGSDFNVEASIHNRIEEIRIPIAELLETVYSLKPLVAQRHYVETGNLRYFERHYADSLSKAKEFQCSDESYDGLIVYWLDPKLPESIPSETEDKKPIVWVHVANSDLLRTRAKELQILRSIQKDSPELRSDGVARKEVKYRLVEAERLLDETIAQAFDWLDTDNQCCINNDRVEIQNARAFQTLLSDISDKVYSKHLKLDNELINRRELTSQGAKARRELIEAMIECGDQPRLGLDGYGPEVAIYCSVLEATGIHRQENDDLGFHKPKPKSGVYKAWVAIEKFCFKAKDEQVSIGLLYENLSKPPYGIKQGVIPVLLASVLLNHVDDVGIYKDGTFIPVLGPEHFELLVKDPSRFSVKYFEMVGLRSQIFKELEAILRSPNAKKPTGARNTSLLMVAKPLFGFVRKLPKYTLNTKRISESAQQVISVLQKAQEPDELLFVSLPTACGLEPIKVGDTDDTSIAKKYRKHLVQCLHEIQTASDTLLSDAKSHLYDAFHVRQKEGNLREDLRVRASYLIGQCIEPILKRFLIAAADDAVKDKEWLEALVMIVADKPVRSWTDDDITRFEIALSDLVRRFQNLEALQKEVQARGAGFEAQRITATEPDGKEIHEVLWIDDSDRPLIERLITETLEKSELKDNVRLQKAFAAKLIKKVLGSDAEEAIDELIEAKSKRKVKKKYG